MASIRIANLRDRLVALILMAALPTLALAAYLHVGQRREAVEEGRETALRFARRFARAPAQRLVDARRLLAALAVLPERDTRRAPPGLPRSSGSSPTSRTWAWPERTGRSIAAPCRCRVP